MELRDPFARLAALRERLGAPIFHSTFGDELAPLRKIERELEQEGIEVKHEEIEKIGPFLTYKGEILAILYIFNSNSPRSDLIGNHAGMSGTPKFHFMWCRTLDQMSRNQRFGRYVLSRSKENTFKVEACEQEDSQICSYGQRHELEDIRLFPCQNCLNEVEYHGFAYGAMTKAARLQAVNDFSIREYLDENDGNLAVMKLVPENTAETAPGGAYTPDFPKISTYVREAANWRCSRCNVDMSGHKRGLHTHHINGVKADNRIHNLAALCALCHRGVDSFHNTMHVAKETEQFIRARR